MDLLDVIAQSHGGRGVQVLGAKFGLSERQTRAAIDQLAPAVMAGLRRQLQSPEGVSGLVAALATGDHGRYLDRDDDRIVDDGNAILGHVFKSKDVSRGVADRAAQASGVSPDVLRKMLPVMSAMVMGALSKQVMGDRPAVGQNPSQPTAGTRGVGPLTRRAGSAGPPLADEPKSRADETRLARKNRSAAASQPTPATRPRPTPSAAPARSGRTATPPQPAQRAAPPSAAPSAGAGGLGGLLGQLFGGGPGGGSPSAAGGGLGAILGQFVGGSGGAAAGGGGIGDLLSGIFGKDAKPEVRDQATRSVGDLFAGLLGGGTSQGNSADEMLDAVTRRRTGR